MDPTLEPVVFGTAVEGMRKALGKQFTPALLAKFKADGIDFEKAQVAYTLDAWLQVIRTLGVELGGEVPENDRYQYIGRLFMRGFVETPLGFAALAAGKVFGVKRTLMRMGRNFRTAANYIETEVADVGAKEIRIRTFISEKFLPRVSDRSMLIVEYRQGVLQEVLSVLGAKGVVKIVDVNPARHDVTFHITWE